MERKDIWPLVVNEDRLYQVVFNEENTKEEAIALFRTESFQDVLDEEVLQTNSITTY